MQIRLLSFGISRDYTGHADRSFTLNDGNTVGDLRIVLRRDFGLSSDVLHFGVAVNQAYVDDSHTLSEGDEVALIPPVSGG